MTTMFQPITYYTTPEPLKIEFNPPISDGRGVSLTSLIVKEPTAQQAWVAEQHLIEKNGNRAKNMYLRKLLSLAPGVPEEVLDLLPASSFIKAAQFAHARTEDGIVNVQQEEVANAPDTMTIQLSESVGRANHEISVLQLRELALHQMMKADSALRDYTPASLRLWQQLVVTSSSGADAVSVGMLPVSVLNKAAAYVSVFSNGVQRT